MVLDAITWFKQSAIRWQGRDLTVYVDPWDVPEGDPAADLLLITHAHFDHYSEDDLSRLRRDDTIVVAPHDIAATLRDGDVRAMRPGERIEAKGLAIDAVPAYNVHPDRLEMHPRDNEWLGFVLDLGGTRVYLAGDTDHIPEMRDIDAEVAFVPIGGTYTMDVPEAAGAVKDIAPRIAVPYHYGFVVGARELGEQFVQAIAPIEGRLLEPVNPFPAQPDE